jgi:hypothetical protein
MTELLATYLGGVALGRGERGATVDDQRVARDVARVVRQQEAHRVTDVPAGALQAERRAWRRRSRAAALMPRAETIGV